MTVIALSKGFTEGQNMSEIEKKIIASGKMTREQLEANIKKKMTEGARSRQSAVNKVYREIAIEVMGVEDISGFFLQDYERRKGGLSVYLQTAKRETTRLTVSPETKPPQKLLSIGQPVKVTKCTKKRNIFTGLEWLETTKDSTIVDTTLGVSFYKLGSTVLPLEGGIVFIRAKVLGVWEVSKFDEEGRRGEAVPVLGKGGAVNLRVTVVPMDVPDVKRMSIKITDEKRLSLLIGDDVSWLGEDGAVMELADMLKNNVVLIFGSVRDTIAKGKIEEKKVSPYFDIRNFGWMVPSPEAPTDGATDTVETEEKAKTPAKSWGNKGEVNDGKAYLRDDGETTSGGEQAKDEDEPAEGEDEPDESGEDELFVGDEKEDDK